MWLKVLNPQLNEREHGRKLLRGSMKSLKINKAAALVHRED